MGCLARTIRLVPNSNAELYYYHDQRLCCFCLYKVIVWNFYRFIKVTVSEERSSVKILNIEDMNTGNWFWNMDVWKLCQMVYWKGKLLWAKYSLWRGYSTQPLCVGLNSVFHELPFHAVEAIWRNCSWEVSHESRQALGCFIQCLQGLLCSSTQNNFQQWQRLDFLVDGTFFPAESMPIRKFSTMNSILWKNERSVSEIHWFGGKWADSLCSKLITRCCQSWKLECWKMFKETAV